MHFDDNDLVKFTSLCVNAEVAIKGRNFYPKWGLHNGASGTVRQIVFAEGNNPNNGDLPEYVVVEFKNLQLPTAVANECNKTVRLSNYFMFLILAIAYYCYSSSTNKHYYYYSFQLQNYIKIPMVELQCNQGCCKATFCPLKLNWARTIHTTQSMEAGPSTKSKKHDFFKIIGDAGTTDFERRNPGLLYTLLSRAITLGGLGEQELNSALYFVGSNMSESRMTQMATNNNGTKSKAILKRALWIEYLDQKIKEWNKNNTKYFDKEAGKTFKSDFIAYKNMKIETTIDAYIDLLQKKTDDERERDKPSTKWMDENRSNMKKSFIINKTESMDENNNKKEMTNKLSEGEDKEIEIIHDEVKNSSIQKLSEDENEEIEILFDEGETSSIPQGIEEYYNNIIDVRGNGSCGYYCIQHGLRHLKVLYETDMNNFQKSIYNFFETKCMNDIYPEITVNKEDIKKRIYSDEIDFNDKCDRYYYFDVASMMPIISVMFDINMICYATQSCTTGKYTSASIKKENKSTLINKIGHVAPMEVIGSSTYKDTITMIHVDDIHYKYLNPN